LRGRERRRPPAYLTRVHKGSSRCLVDEPSAGEFGCGRWPWTSRRCGVITGIWRDVSAWCSKRICEPRRRSGRRGVPRLVRLGREQPRFVSREAKHCAAQSSPGSSLLEKPDEAVAHPTTPADPGLQTSRRGSHTTVTAESRHPADDDGASRHPQPLLSQSGHRMPDPQTEKTNN
jgi:hypothetical protein